MAEGEELNVMQGKLRLGSPQLGYLRESNDVLSDEHTLRRRLQNDGYIFVRGLIPTDAVEAANAVILNYLAEQDMLEEGTPLPAAIMNSKRELASKQGLLFGPEVLQKLSHTPEANRMLAGPELRGLCERLLGGRCRTFDYRWLRMVCTGEYTGAHMDSVYMGRGTSNLLTCWVPFMPVPLAKGGLVVCESSNSSPEFQRLRETYGRMDVDKDDVRGTGWFSEDPLEPLKFGGRWLTADFKPGDVVIFTMQTLHGSANNTTNTFRVSCDVRFQLEAEAVDDRWVGQQPPGHSKFRNRFDTSLYPISMDEAKRSWGLA